MRRPGPLSEKEQAYHDGRRGIPSPRKGVRWTEEQRAKLIGRTPSGLGRVLSVEARAKLAEATARAHERGAFRGPTKLEHQLRELLKQSGLEFQEQVRFGRYVVDAWVPELGLVFEADGQFWYHHQDKDREARRDGYLVERGVTAVIHLDDDDLAQFKPIVEE